MHKTLRVLCGKFLAQIPYRVSTWATKFQISNALFHQVITQRNRKHKNYLLESCLNHQTLVTNM